jgi:hypothetical protein
VEAHFSVAAAPCIPTSVADSEQAAFRARAYNGGMDRGVETIGKATLKIRNRIPSQGVQPSEVVRDHGLPTA